MEEIKKVAVLGSGIMGSGIAAHLASAGIPSYLLDIVPKDVGVDRNRLAKAGIENILKARPAAIFSKKDIRFITPGNFEDDWEKLKECDWVIEVVVERLEIKRPIFERVEKVIRPGTIVTSNTSGLSLASMFEGRSLEFRRHFLITHFFNPVRYMKLVEVVSSAETDPVSVKKAVSLLEEKLGKGVVYAKDTPNFVANRIGVYNWCSTLRTIMEEGYQVGEVDKILGSAIGRPKSGMFRTSDMVGLDTLVHVAQHTYEYCTRDEKREAYRIPPSVEKMVEKRLLGDKTGQGFYKKVKKEDGSSEILQLNLRTVEYESQPKVRHESLSAAKNIDDVSKRIRHMVWQKDRAGKLAWGAVRDMLVYSANRIPEIADDLVNIDNAMKWGFNWSLGPFETWDALGVQSVVDRLREEKIPVPAIVQKVLTRGVGSFYRAEKGRRTFFDLKGESYLPVPEREGVLILKSIKEQAGVIQKNDAASLIDLGDGVAGLEFHSKMNAIDGDIVEMMDASVTRVEKEFSGLVIYNEGENFSVGANLMLLFLAAQTEDWNQIEQVVRSFQDACMRLRYSAKPVVAAPFNLTLGGGCEVSLGADQIVAHGELYIGLVEVGVGLIPAGGGCKEMIRRFDETVKMGPASPSLGGPASPATRLDSVDPRRSPGGPFPKVQRAFETIAFAKVSTSAKEAVELGYMTKKDGVILSRDHLLSAAKQRVTEISKGYQKPLPRNDISLPGKGGFYALVSAVDGFRSQGVITEHDAVIAKKLAGILTGGEMANPGLVSEQKLLDLEREAFLSLVGMEKSQARIQQMLLTGKPLRN